MVRLRFAPSPSGYIHMGNVRAALFNYLYAKKYSGRLILRVEDTDVSRNSEDYVQGIIDDLAWLGIHFDEGPHVGGDYGPYRQTQRLELYRHYAQQLLDSGFAEKNYDKDEDGVSKSDEDAYGILFRPKEEKIKFFDAVFGYVEKEVEPFIIMKSDGTPTFHFAVVVDDELMKITQVLRGQDHLGNTVKHIALSTALGFKSPKYAHYSLTFGLSKRDQSTSIRGLRKQGYLPKAILNGAMLLGWAPKDQKEKFDVFEKIDEFELSDLSRVNSNFDPAKLEWLSAQYIRQSRIEDIYPIALNYLQEQWPSICNAMQESELRFLFTAFRDHLKKLSDIVEEARFFFEQPDFHDEKQQGILNTPSAHLVLRELRKLIQHNKIESEDDSQKILMTVKAKTKLNGKSFFLPIRVALSGKLHGLELKSILFILGQEKLLQRLNLLITK